MATPQKPRKIDATFKQIISSQKASPSSAREPTSNTQAKRSQGTAAGSLPQREGSTVKDSHEVFKEVVPVQKLADFTSSGPREESVVQDSVDITQDHDNELYDLSPEQQASSNRIGTSQTRKSTLFGTDLTIPSMGPKSTAKSSNAAKSAGKNAPSQPSQIVPPITNTGATSSLAALRSIKAGKSAPSDDPQHGDPNSKTQPPEKTFTDTHAHSSRKPHTQPSRSATHSSQKAKRSEPIERPSSKSQSNVVKTIPDEFDLVPSPERPMKPLRDPRSSAQLSTKKAPPKLPATKQSTAKQSTTKQSTARQVTTKQPTATQATAKKPATRQTAAKQPTTKQPATKKTSVKQPGIDKTSTDRPAPKRRGRASNKSNVRVEDSDDEADYADAKPSKSEPTAPVRSTRAKTRAQMKDASGDDSAMAQLPATRSRKKSAENPSQQNPKAPRATLDESYREFENSVTNMNNYEPAETAESLEEGPADPPVKRHRTNLAAQVEVKKEKAEAPWKLLNQSNAKLREPKASTKRAPSVITIEDDDDDDGDDFSEDDEDPASSGFITHGDGEEEANEEPPGQDRPSVQTPAVAASSPPGQPRAEQDYLTKERAEHKPNIIEFRENGPRNQGSLGSKGTAESRPPFSRKPLLDHVDGHLSSGNDPNEQVFIPPPSKQPANDPAGILEDMLGTTRKEQHHLVYTQNVVDPPRKPTPPTKRSKATEPAVPRPSMTIPAPSAPPTMIYVGNTKRSNPGDIRGQTKRSKLFDDEKERPQRVEVRTAEKGALRKFSQHTVTDEGSPILNGAQQPDADTSPIATGFHEPPRFDLPPRQAVQEDPSYFFPKPATSQRATQRDMHAVYTEEPVTIHQQKRQASPELEPQAIPHARSDELMEGFVEETERTDVQEHPFAGGHEPYMSGKQVPNGLMDFLRSKVEKEIPKEPKDAHSEDSQEGIEDVDENDPDKTLVNEDSDDDSARSSDTDVEQDRHHDELSEWRNALSSHQGEVHDALVRVAHGFTMHLVDHETAIGDIISDFGQDGGKIVKQLEDRHEAELKQYSKQVLLARKNLIRGFKLTEDSLFEDLEEIKASGGDYYTKIHKRVDARKRLDQLEAYF